MKYLDPIRELVQDDDLKLAHHAIQSYCRLHHKFAFDPAHPVVRLHEPTIGYEEINAALDVLLSTKVTQGAKVKAFEQAFCKDHGFAHGVACNSGSSANLLAIASLRSLGMLKAGDEVIVSALSWSTTVWPLIQHGLVPVLVDCDPQTFNMDLNEVEHALAPHLFGHGMRAIMPVHVYGNPCDMDVLVVMCGHENMLLIEDCCEAMGALYNEQPVGSFGTVGTFSFYLSHHITTLEGGIAVTNDTGLAERMRIQREHGWIRGVENKEAFTAAYPTFDPRFLFVDTGYNLRLTEVQAAIGLHQIPRLEDYIDIRRRNNDQYAEELGVYDFFKFQQETPNGRSSCFDFSIVLDNAPFTVQEITEHLAQHNIETRPIITGNLALQPAMKLYPHRVVGDLKHASNIWLNGFSLGNHHYVNDEAREYVVKTIKEFILKHS